MKKYIILLLLLISCGSSKEVKENTTVNTTKEKLEYVSQPISTNYSVALECDSLGNVKPVNYLKSSGVNNASVDVYNNRLNVRLLTGQSSYSSLKTTSDKESEKQSDIVRYKVSPWHWFFHLVAGIIIFILIKISSINPLNWIKKLKFW